jgi:hypothetical protein
MIVLNLLSPPIPKRFFIVFLEIKILSFSEAS